MIASDHEMRHCALNETTRQQLVSARIDRGLHIDVASIEPVAQVSRYGCCTTAKDIGDRQIGIREALARIDHFFSVRDRLTIVDDQRRL